MLDEIRKNIISLLSLNQQGLKGRFIVHHVHKYFEDSCNYIPKKDVALVISELEKENLIFKKGTAGVWRLVKNG